MFGVEESFGLETSYHESYCTACRQFVGRIKCRSTWTTFDLHAGHLANPATDSI